MLGVLATQLLRFPCAWPWWDAVKRFAMLMWQQGYLQQRLAWRRLICFPFMVRGVFTRSLEILGSRTPRPNAAQVNWPPHFDKFSKLALGLWVTFCMSPSDDLCFLPWGWVCLRFQETFFPELISITELLLAHPPPLLSETYLLGHLAM